MESNESVFYTNACQVCMRYGKDIDLKRCEGCMIVGYCSKEHQTEDLLQHKEICIATKKFFENYLQYRLLTTVRNGSAGQWAWIKRMILLGVRDTLERKLQVHEQQMFLFPRACLVCHQRDELENCENCPHASFCAEHKDNPEHNKICDTIKFCFDLDKMKLYSKVHSVKFQRTFTEETVFQDMSNFIQTFVNLQAFAHVPLPMCVAVHSEYLTRQLTVFHAWRKLKKEAPLPSDQLIHILTANDIDRSVLPFWELLLHIIPTLTYLTIVVVGPQISVLICNNLKLCDACTSKGKMIYIQTVYDSYEIYMYRKHIRDAPDFVVEFNSYIAREEEVFKKPDKWVTYLQTVARLRCPLILTSHSSEYAERNKALINKTLKYDVTPIHCSRNPFASLRPHRDLDFEGVIYQNYHLTIYNNLRLNTTQV